MKIFIFFFLIIRLNRIPPTRVHLNNCTCPKIHFLTITIPVQWKTTHISKRFPYLTCNVCYDFKYRIIANVAATDDDGKLCVYTIIDSFIWFRRFTAFGFFICKLFLLTFFSVRVPDSTTKSRTDYYYYYYLELSTNPCLRRRRFPLVIIIVVDRCYYTRRDYYKNIKRVFI